MWIRSLPLACLLAFVACRVPVPEPAPADHAWRSHIDAQLQALTLLAQRGSDAASMRQVLLPPAEAPGTAELTARLAALTDRIDGLVARLPAAGQVPAAPVDASATGPARTSAADADAPCILAVQQALQVLDRMRSLHVENLANVMTPGYKIAVLVTTSEASPLTGLQLPKAVRVDRLMTIGTLEITERNLDVAIDGDGFFAVVLPDGSTGYTRHGGLQVDANGRIVTADGRVLVPGITLPADTLELSIDPEGRVTARTAGAPDTSTLLGQITLARFINPGSLRAAGDGVLRPTDATGAPIIDVPGCSGLGPLKQGFLERSNVQTVTELVNLQLVERHRAALVRVLAGLGVYVR